MVALIRFDALHCERTLRCSITWLCDINPHDAFDGISDLLTSVLASRHRLTVVHYDAEFEAAASVLDSDQIRAAAAGRY
ncbi:hypothetical protein A5742_06290 [Mycolicibacterium fortuitum]|uniref:Uncharacterized protein n=1 Tax=Mycolicibacterium fortuitum TaxID=1766 RepID=A0ABD6QHG5_MYCFO|nr:hypothetical protein A5742_06290 [Mycolicibacterium fortuitum]